MPTLRCRGYRRNGSSLIWSSQCQHPAKGERTMFIGLEAMNLPACGYHLASRFVVGAYHQQSEKYERPVEEYIR